jgi:hypothetical protein
MTLQPKKDRAVRNVLGQREPLWAPVAVYRACLLADTFFRGESFDKCFFLGSFVKLLQE